MFAQFINGEGGPSYVDHYRKRFQPSAYLQKPKQAVAVFFACAETEEEAERIISSLDLSKVMQEQGMPSLEPLHPKKRSLIHTVIMKSFD